MIISRTTPAPRPHPSPPAGACDARHPLHDPDAAQGGATLSYLDGASTSPAAEGVSGSHSALPSGMVSCLVKSPTGPGQRVTIPRRPDRDALRAGPPITSRHYGVGPTTTTAVASGPRSVSRSLRSTRVPSGSPGHGGLDGGNRGRRLLVYTHVTDDIPDFPPNILHFSPKINHLDCAGPQPNVPGGNAGPYPVYVSCTEGCAHSGTPHADRHCL
jgi:hypothetical protein